MKNPCNNNNDSSSSSSLPTTFFSLLLLHFRCNDSNNTYSSELLLRDFATREFNAFLWLSLIVITAILLRKLFNLFSLWYKAKSIPGPPSPSFFGHCHLISRQNLTDVLSESHENYGPILKLWLGPTQLLVSVKDPVLIQEMLIKAKDKLPFTGKAFHLAFGQPSLFAPSFEKVQKRRELLATELNERLIKTADPNLVKVSDFIIDKIESIRARGSIDCRLVSQHMAFTIMGATFFGDGFLAWPKAAMYEELFMLIAKDACFWASYNVTPFWRQGFWRYQGLCTKLKCLTQDILQHCKTSWKLFGHIDQNVNSESKIEMKSAHGEQRCSDDEFRDCYFFRDLNDHQNYKEEPCGNIMSVMFHGCQTTAALIANVLTRLAMHLEMQDKIYSEISMVGRNPSKYEQEDVYRMPLLLATVYESARLLPTSPMLQRCSLKHDLSFATGVIIPAGTILVVPVQLVQKDDSSWGSDASDFNPYRFLSNSTKGSVVLLMQCIESHHPQFHTRMYIIKGELWGRTFSKTKLKGKEQSPFPLQQRRLLIGSTEELTNAGFSSFVLNDPNENAAFLPFGSGARACVGQKLVIQVIATLLASLLKKYEIRLNSGSDDNDSKPILKTHLLQHHPHSPILFVRRDQ